MKIRGVDFVMFPVSDLARAARFYRETLGLPQEVYSEEWQWAEFDCGNLTLSLKGASAPGETGTAGRLALAVGDIQTACQEIERSGAHIVSGPTNNEVCWSLEILDPDGNRLILHQRADRTVGREPARNSAP